MSIDTNVKIAFDRLREMENLANDDNPHMSTEGYRARVANMVKIYCTLISGKKVLSKEQETAYARLPMLNDAGIFPG